MTRATEVSPSSPSVKTTSKASMTTFAPRPPLQQLDHPHIMSERGNGRRTSARLADKEDAPLANGYNLDPVKKSQIVPGGKQNKGNTSGAGAKTGAKRKPGEYKRHEIWLTCHARKCRSRKAIQFCVSTD